jgi:hypothetical protein
MTTEEWKPIMGWPYEVSNLGRVRRTAKTTNTWSGRILRPSKTWGYRFVGLCRDGEKWQARIGRLVCEAFHGAAPPDAQVRHLDGNRANDSAANVRWSDRNSNEADKIIHGTLLSGERCPWSKLTKRQANELRRRYREHKIKRKNQRFVRLRVVSLRNWRRNMA